jgi:gamma-glutamyltranspeptidase/glutathione hydrolase
MRRIAPALITLLIATTAAAQSVEPTWIERSEAGMVASDSRAASRIGARILNVGGNAFDAAIATSLALAVARPQSTGLGGGGFMVAYVAAKKEFVVLDFREMAPAAATPERYAKLLAEAGDGPSPTVYGGNAVGVPGQVAGLFEIHKRYATFSFERLANPAINLADAGFVVDEHYRDACRGVLADFEKWPQLSTEYARLHQTLLQNGTLPAVGERIRRPKLASTLRLLARQEAAAFYDGWIAQAIVRAVNGAGGRMTAADLAGYRVKTRSPLRAKFGDYDVIAMPPPSSGGTCIIETLNLLDAYVGANEGGLAAVRESGKYYPMLVEALKHSFADRARWLGDADFADVPVQRLIDPAYARTLAKKDVADLDDYGSAQLPDDRGTSHFCIADNQGNVVAITETINGTFGSLVIAEPYGILLNNQIDDFAAEPGKPNLYGLIQGAANAIAPGKRPLSSMSPTLVFRDGKPVLALGASGGPRIITSVLQVLLNVLVFEQDLATAIQAPRIHHQWRPDVVYFDAAPPAELASRLRDAGLKISDQHKTGVVQAIHFLPDGMMVGASDPRKGGRPAGVGSAGE